MKSALIVLLIPLPLLSMGCFGIPTKQQEVAANHPDWSLEEVQKISTYNCWIGMTVDQYECMLGLAIPPSLFNQLGIAPKDHIHAGCDLSVGVGGADHRHYHLGSSNGPSGAMFIGIFKNGRMIGLGPSASY